MKPTIIITVIIVVILAILGYWYFMMGAPMIDFGTDEPNTGSGFSPLNRPVNNNVFSTSTIQISTTTTNVVSTSTAKIPTLRLLSNTPVGGFGILSSSTQTIIRWIDRGRGNIYEAESDSLNIKTISNTLLPRMYQSAWNKNLTSFIGAMISEEEAEESYIYAQLIKRAAPQLATTSKLSSTTKESVARTIANGTSTPNLEKDSELVRERENLDTAPYELNGKTLPSNTIAYALSPQKDKVFFMTAEDSVGTGFISNIDGSRATKIFETPITQVNVEWPNSAAIFITTKGSATLNGFSYIVNPQNGVWGKILGPINGLSTKISADGRYVAYSGTTGQDGVFLRIYDTKTSTSKEAIIETLADKCVWGDFFKNILYCAAPFKKISAVYPDDWYKGTLSTIDKIWQINAESGEVKLVSDLISQADRVIDAFNLDTDSNDDFLVFMNKNDLSLWSLDLINSGI